MKVTDQPDVLLKSVLASPGDRELLERVRCEAESILEYLSRTEFFEGLEDSVPDPMWTAEVYGALGEVAERLSRQELQALDALFDANSTDEVSIGVAFKETLLEAIPDRLKDLDSWFKNVSKVSTEEKEFLLGTPAALAAMPYSENLAKRGATPLTVFYATEAISMLSERLISGRVLEPPFVAGLAAELTHSFLDTCMAVSEIEMVADCKADFANALYPWLIEVGQFKPFIFEGFEAEPCKQAILLKQSTKKFDNVFQRWGLTRRVPERAVPVPA